ncbi:MAG: type II toxin-antitoxin system PemK/MazF family toxin [Alphaproteobacteria bacterium]
MTILYHPRAGEIFICKYPKDMKEPEMVKPRPVVAISPKLKSRNNLVTIVPLSSTKPRNKMPYHYELLLSKPLPDPWGTNPCWAICDHPMTVGFERLNLIRLGKDQYGKRKYYQYRIEEAHLTGIRHGVLQALGLANLAEKPV